jgi:peptidoglycan/xylan/chitin deacetylase (PgdA/CDA1 family)
MAEYNNSEMQNNEIQRNARENERINNENERITNEIERDAREQIRIEKEIERQNNENIRQGLYDRLEDIDSQLAQKASKNEVVKKGHATLNDFDEETRSIIQGMEQGEINAVLGEGNVYSENINSSVIKAIKDSDVVGIYEGINIFNSSNCIDDYIISSDGSLGHTVGFSTSDLIDVSLYHKITATNLRRFAEYDYLGNFIKGTYLDINYSDQTINLNENTRYIRISVLSSSKTTTLVTGGDYTSLKRYIFQNKPILKTQDNRELWIDNVVNNKFEVKPGGKNLFDKHRVIEDARISTNGEIDYNAIGWVTSDFIEINGDVTLSGAVVRYIHEYDKYKNPIVDTFQELNYTDVFTFETNVETKYIRLTYYKTTKLLQVENDIVNTEYEDVYYSIFDENNKIFDLIDNKISDLIDNSEIDYSNVILKNINILSNFDEDDWLLKEGAELYNSEMVCRGFKSVKTTSINNTNTSIYKTVNKNLKDKVLYFKFYIEDVSKLSMFQMFLGTEKLADYYGYYPAVSTLKNGWNTLLINTNSFNKKNNNTSADLLENVKEIRILQKSKQDCNSTIHFDCIGYSETAIKKGKLVIQFDDQWDGCWKYAKPIMDKYGFRGVIYVIKDLVGVNQFMTLEQLKICYENGWDISTHGQVELTRLTSNDSIREELLKNYNYLLDNGFIRSACHYCTPAGKYNEMSLLEIKKIFKTHRTTKFGYNTLPTNNKYELFNISGNENDISFLKSVVDRTEKEQTLTIINWHQILESGATGNEGTSSTFSEFINYVASKNIDVVTMSDIFNPMD